MGTFIHQQVEVNNQYYATHQYQAPSKKML